MSIEIRHLKAAVATADAKSFSRAAKVLSVKQSALSRRVQTLEQMLGVQLFDRTKRGTFPTENGKAFLTVARRIVTDIDKRPSFVGGPIHPKRKDRVVFR